MLKHVLLLKLVTKPPSDGIKYLAPLQLFARASNGIDF